jgi:hypothetical protein
MKLLIILALFALSFASCGLKVANQYQALSKDFEHNRVTLITTTDCYQKGQTIMFQDHEYEILYCANFYLTTK